MLPVCLFEVKPNLPVLPDNPNYTEMMVQVSCMMDFYKAESLLRCLTDGLKLFYMFSKIQGVKIEWKHNVFYDNAVPSSE